MAGTDHTGWRQTFTIAKTGVEASLAAFSDKRVTIDYMEFYPGQTETEREQSPQEMLAYRDAYERMIFG